MKKLSPFRTLCLLFISLIFWLFPTPVAATNQSKIEVTPENYLKPSGDKQLLLGDLDQLQRPSFAHIQMKKRHEPSQGREPRLTYNPTGWHNFKFYYGDGNKEAWLMHRGHLIGHQFSGLNDEPKNLVALTAWLNAGDYNKSNPKNTDSMLYYEQKLDKWLTDNPNDWLDYRVTPIYVGDELVPRQIALQYVGLTDKGDLIPIQVGGKETIDRDGMTHVLLDNTSPNASIDYASGQATNTVSSARVQEAQAAYQASQALAPTPTADQGQTVYVARNGTAEVYWYDLNRMPANTNFNRVVSMTEEEALAAGKRHSLRE